MKKIIIIIVSVLLVVTISILLIVKFNKKEEIEVPEKEFKVIDQVKLIINDEELILKLENNLATNALVEKLDNGDITFEAKEYGGFEKVGELGFKLPRTDKYTKTKPGDVVLYSGDQISIFYGENTWNYTMLGKIENKSEEELKSILGEGDVTVKITK